MSSTTFEPQSYIILAKGPPASVIHWSIFVRVEVHRSTAGGAVSSRATHCARELPATVRLIVVVFKFFHIRQLYEVGCMY